MAVESFPPIDRHLLVLVDGRTFAISGEDGDMFGSTHGLVHDDLRHLSRFQLEVGGSDIEVLASSTPTPLSAVVVGKIRDRSDVTSGAVVTSRAVMTRRRWVAGGLREDIHIHNTSVQRQTWTVRICVAADFAHLFDVKSGIGGVERLPVVGEDGVWTISAGDGSASTRLTVQPAPDETDLGAGRLSWTVQIEPKQEVVLTVAAEPIVDGIAAVLAFPIGTIPAEAIPMQRLASWRAQIPSIVSTDPRLSSALDQALADIAALRIIDTGHLDRPVVAAGAPWFMTLFGRDSLLTSWMTLPFDPSLAVGVLSTLAELQGTKDDPVSEEQPGKILHELRRRGGDGPFVTRARYYGAVDATPLFVMLAAEAHRWGALNDELIELLQTAVDGALEWIIRAMDAGRTGFVEYERRNPNGLSNQGWKDSWDGITFQDGSLPSGPIALVEVQGYAYAALCGAAELSRVMRLSRSGDECSHRAAILKQRFNESFWDARGWFAVGLDGRGQQIDSLTTNPGHALWTGIANEAFADEQLNRFAEPAMWTGWGLRTLAESMTAYDPISYHNGSVWPHDTALCAAGAARHGRWDIVDLLLDGAFDAAVQFDGRPPELFAGLARIEAPTPVVYPDSCSPQAWSSASTLLHLRNMLNLEPEVDGTLRVRRADLRAVPNLRLERLRFAGADLTVEIAEHAAHISASSTGRQTDQNWSHRAR